MYQKEYILNRSLEGHKPNHLNPKKLYQNEAGSNILSKNLIEDEKFFSLIEDRIPGSPNTSRNERPIPIQRKHETLRSKGLVVTILDYLSRRTKFNTSKWPHGRLSFHLSEVDQKSTTTNELFSVLSFKLIRLQCSYKMLCSIT